MDKTSGQVLTLAQGPPVTKNKEVLELLEELILLYKDDSTPIEGVMIVLEMGKCLHINTYQRNMTTPGLLFTAQAASIFATDRIQDAWE